MPDEKRSKPIEIQRCLLRLAHRLHDGRKWKEIFADQTDDEVVVVRIEAVASQAHVVRVIGGAERLADGTVFGKDGALLIRRKLFERAVPAQRVPNGPPPVRIEDGPQGTMEEHVLQIGFVAEASTSARTS